MSLRSPSGPASCPVSLGGHPQAVLGRETQGDRDVVRVGGQHDRGGTLVHQQVEGSAGGIPLVVTGHDDRPERSSLRSRRQVGVDLPRAAVSALPGRAASIISLLSTRAGHAPAPRPRHPSRPPGVILATVIAAQVLSVASATVVAVALPALARDLGAAGAEQQWVIDAFVLVFASLLIAGGALADRYGRRTALLAGLAIFAVGLALVGGRAHARSG